MIPLNIHHLIYSKTTSYFHSLFSSSSFSSRLLFFFSFPFLLNGFIYYFLHIYHLLYSKSTYFQFLFFSFFSVMINVIYFFPFLSTCFIYYFSYDSSKYFSGWSLRKPLLTFLYRFLSSLFSSPLHLYSFLFLLIFFLLFPSSLSYVTVPSFIFSLDISQYFFISLVYLLSLSHALHNFPSHPHRGINNS